MPTRLTNSPFVRAAAAPLSAVYAAAVARRNRMFDRGVGVTRLPVPVISVGNLCVGGTGKTPVVGAIVSRLIDRDLRPCIAMRGYAPHGGESDEASLHRERFPGLPIIAQPDRLAGITAVMSREPGRVGCVVLDDGFQHRQIARDLDIVLIDATRPPHEDRLLPAGRLREPIGSLGRAHYALLTRCEQVSAARRDEIAENLSRWTGSVVPVRSLWTALCIHENGAESELPLAVARGRSILVVSAIGNPSAFESTAGAEFGDPPSLRFRDHDPYARPALDRIGAAVRLHRADLILTTEKDWIKLRRHTPKLGIPVARPRLDIEFLQGGDDFWGAVEQAASGQSRPG